MEEEKLKAWEKRLGKNSTFFKNRHLCYNYYNTWCLTTKTYEQGVSLTNFLKHTSPHKNMTNFFLWVAAGATHLTLSVWVSPAVATIISSLTLATMAAKHTDDVLRTSGYQCKTFRMYYDKFEHLQQVAHTSKYNLAAFDEEALKLSKELECYLTSITFVSPDQDDYETT